MWFFKGIRMIDNEWMYKGGWRGGMDLYGRKVGTVIDYVIGNEETRGKVLNMKVEDWVDSDHQPITVCVEGGGCEQRTGKRKGKVRRGMWTEEERMKFEEYIEKRDGDWKGRRRDGGS